jgi:predicted AlkP superfamily phosphohydrolase/phosphomutase
MSLQKRLGEPQAMGREYWRTSPVISLPSDLQGYIRINLRGRESEGIVGPGADFDEICFNIEEGLLTFVDGDTGKPIVEKVMRRKNLFPQGTHADELPDLIVKWASSPAANHRAIVSPKYGPVPWTERGHNPDGRSGNHSPEGFLIATGDNIRPNSQTKNAHILDLAPTILALLDTLKPPYMPGNVLPITD